MPFVFNAVELCVLTTDEKPWTRAKEVCRALEYNKKTTDIVKSFCSPENYARKYQMSGVHTTINWSKDWQKYDTYINEEGMIDC